MTDCFYIWKLTNMPAAATLAALCHQYSIERVAVKVLDGTWKYNTPNGSQTYDAPLIDYLNVLRNAGIVVEGWGYHYPGSSGAQGDAIMERKAKLGFTTYHVNCEGEWKQLYGMPAAAKALMDKLQVNGFEVLLSSYRYPSQHSPFPFGAFMNHPAMDAAAPQVYWIGAHNAAAQLSQCLSEYAGWNKPIYPTGAAFATSDWEPTVADIHAFNDECFRRGITRKYWWSLDWIITHQRYDWLEAITGESGDEVPPPAEPDEFSIVNCTWLNGRSTPGVVDDNRVVSVRAGQRVTNLHQESGQWRYCGLGPVRCWMHGDYLA